MILLCGRRSGGSRPRIAARFAVWPIACLLLAVFCSAPGAAGTSDRVWATGRIVDCSGRPVAGAFVAAYDERHQIVDYAHTDAQGHYALAIPINVLHIEPHHLGVFTRVCSGVERLLGMSAEGVAAAVQVSVHAVTSVPAAGLTNPAALPLAASAQYATDRSTRAATTFTRKRAAQSKEQEELQQPGALLIKAVAPNCDDLVGVTHTYWIEREYKDEGYKGAETIAAWLDPVKLEAQSSKQKSCVQPVAVHLCDALVEPSLVEHGQQVRVTVTLTAPTDPPIYPVVIARSATTGEVWQLQSIGGNKYSGAVTIGPRYPAGDQTVSILAYPAAEQKSGRRLRLEAAIAGNGMWDTSHPFKYDPLFVLSQNRIDLTLTVVPKRRTE